MRRNITFFTYLLICALEISAQSNLTSVQGIPYDFDNLPKVAEKTEIIRSTDSGKFTFNDIRFWVGEGANEAALVIDWYYDDETALVWGYRWDGDAYGIDLFEEIAKADPRLVLLTQETNLGYTIAGIGYAPSQEELMLNYDLEAAKVNPQVAFGFDEPNVFLGQKSCPADPLQEINDAIEEGVKIGVIYHPFNYTNYGYGSYDYDHWHSLNPSTKWKSGWYTGYWSYQVKDSPEDTFMYSGIGATLRRLVNGSWDGWGYQDSWEQWEGVQPREPLTAALPFIALNSRNITLEPTETAQLTATLYGGNMAEKQIYWSSSNPEIVSVDKNGLLTGISVGTVTISAFVDQEDVIAGSCIINCVDVPIQSINVSPESAEMIYGEELQLEVTFLPENATNKNISWRSSNPEIATVDPNGVVKAIGNGNATITVISEDGEKTAGCQLICIVPITGISVSPQEVEMEINEKLQLRVEVLPDNATEKGVNWESSNTQIATVNEEGIVHAISSGKVTIYVSNKDGEHNAESLITVKEKEDSIENSIHSDFSIYPTLTSSSVTIFMQKTASIQLTDITGRILLSRTSDVPETWISLDTYPNGIYFLLIENQITKIIKN